MYNKHALSIDSLTIPLGQQTTNSDGADREANRQRETSLHGICKSLVELGELGRHAEVDGTVTNLDDEAADKVGVDLHRSAYRHSTKEVHPHTFVITLSFLPWLNSDLETAFSMRETALLSSSCPSLATPTTVEQLHSNRGNGKYLGTGNIQLNLPTMRAHQRIKLVADVLKHTQPVVLGERVQEVLHRAAFVIANELLQLSHDLLLVTDGEGRGAEDGGQLAVGLENVIEGAEGLGGLVEGGGFDGSRVLSFCQFAFAFNWCCPVSPPVFGPFMPFRSPNTVHGENTSIGSLNQETYQSCRICAINAVQGHRRPDVLGRGGIGPHADEGGTARGRELLRGGAQTGTGNSSGKHCGSIRASGERRGVYAGAGSRLQCPL